MAPPIVLAPMSGLTNLPMRALCEEAGCGLTITEFIAAPALAGNIKKEVAKLQPSPGGRPFGVQLFGRNPEQMFKAAGLAVRRGAALVDINMGCPVKKVTKGVAGAALMREPSLAAELVQAVVEATSRRAYTTVKMRSGWDATNKNAPEFAQLMVNSGAEAVTIHGRTRQQGFSGHVDLDSIARVKEAVSVPVIGNGDVVDLESLERMIEHTGCDGVMIGRAALGNPWIFARIAAWWRGEPAPPPPTTKDRLEMYLRHLRLYMEIAEEQRAMIEMRKFAVWYLKEFPNASSLRKTIYARTDVNDIFELINGLIRDEDGLEQGC